MSYILTTMKTLRLMGTTLLRVMVAVNFAACSYDEDEQTIIEQANVIGKWQSTWEKIHKVENGKEVVTSEEAYTNGLRAVSYTHLRSKRKTECGRPDQFRQGLKTVTVE